MKGYEIRFQIYAESEDEAMRAERAIKTFINQHALAGRAVTGDKIADAVGNWEKNAIVRNRIISYFK